MTHLAEMDHFVIEFASDRRNSKAFDHRLLLGGIEATRQSDGEEAFHQQAKGYKLIKLLRRKIEAEHNQPCESNGESLYPT
jgi:hypothetical protein